MVGYDEGNRIPLRCCSRNVLECHEFQVSLSLPDIPEGSIPLIIQQVQDVPVGAASVLMLIDTEVHGQQHELNFDIAPVVERRVVAVPAHLSRQALLVQARVADYTARWNTMGAF